MKQINRAKAKEKMYILKSKIESAEEELNKEVYDLKIRRFEEYQRPLYNELVMLYEVAE